jgi:ferric-dicitrate binding protein FerR (iron transport regulator)
MGRGESFGSSHPGLNMFARFRYRWTISALLTAASVLVCVPALDAQGIGGRFAARVIAETGQVSVLKDGYPIVLNVGDVIQVKQTVVTGPDGYAQFQLEDNTTWEVFKNSKVVFRDNYPSLMDMLYVWIGRVKIFEEHTKGENSKKVTTPTAVISVRGTIYDVVVEDDDGTTFVTVDDGAVEVVNRTYPGNGVLLNPGDSIRVFRGQPLLARGANRDVVVRQALKAMRDAMNQIALGRGNAPGGLPGGVGGARGPQGDPQGKTGGNTGTGTTNGAPPPPTGAPAPGGH